ncbi:MAG TPA: agmatinase [Burkholderiaceae bacterium]|nr:agmatinase [Burkholderiaceae bacterium]
MAGKRIAYQPVNSLKSPRFTGVRTFMRLPHGSDLEPADVAIFGVPFDWATSYRAGARFGPAAIRDASSILKTYCPMVGVDLSENLSILDYGDFATSPGYIEDSFDKIEAQIATLCKAGVIPVGMGGDHAISLPLLRGLTKVHGGPVALLHFDAHSDTAPDYFGHPYNHGTPFYWALEEGLIQPEHSIQVGIRGPLYGKDSLDYPLSKGMRIISGPELHDMGIAKAVSIIRERIANQPVYVTFDIDFLDAAYAPGTGTPEVGGFTTYQAQRLLIDSCLGMDLKGMDLVEVLPAHDHGDITALAGASLMHAFLAVLAKNRS